MLKVAMLAAGFFFVINLIEKTMYTQQQLLVIYNIPRHSGIDIIAGNAYTFIGDSTLTHNKALQQFYLKPSRFSLWAQQQQDRVKGLSHSDICYVFNNKKIILVNTALSFRPGNQKVVADVLIITGDPDINIVDLVAAVTPGIVVFDASNSLWKIARWKKECERLFLHYHSVVDQGAFILNAHD